MPYGLRGLGGRIHGLGCLDGRGFSGYVNGKYDASVPNQVGDTSPDGTTTWNGSEWVSKNPAAANPVYTAPAAPTVAVCNPMDTPCVMGNAASGVAYQTSLGQSQADFNRQRCLANGTDPATCNAQWPAGWTSITPATAGMSPSTIATWTQSPAQAAAQYTASQAPAVATAQGILAADTAAALPAGSPIASAAPSSSGAEGAPLLTSTLNTSTTAGFSLSSIPWWGWLGAAAVGVMAMRGGGR